MFVGVLKFDYIENYVWVCKTFVVSQNLFMQNAKCI